MLAGMWQWQISEFENGQRLIDALQLRIPAAPRAFLQQTIRKGRLRCGGQVLSADLPVSSGMGLTVQVSARFEELAGLSGVPPQHLLYEDQHALVVYKPAGLAMHLTPGHDDNLVDRVVRFVTWRHAPYRVAPVHRLDIGTSGPVLFGKGRWAAGQYGRLLMDGQLSKHYLALVAGNVPSQGRLTSPVAEGGFLKTALTRYRCLAAVRPYSLLDLDLVTGRQHQARRQLADAGWPIVGDRRYGGPPWPGLEHPFLHCHRLCFPDLATQQPRQIEVPLPAQLAEILSAIGLTTVPATANN
jgi:RluA family pseudouridine synthase